MSSARKFNEALDELQRELQVRERCFHRWVAEKKLSATDARDRYERLESAIGYMKQLGQAHNASIFAMVEDFELKGMVGL
jgi:hypothetical protein